ncbi:MAG: Cytochrome oxidase maturation protein cbb3-type [Bacteroidota bacterium]|jgi:cbb3-type cytochrome oxidase maturation protein
MNIIFLLLFFSLLIAVVFLGAFLWSNRDGQFEDVEGPAMRMLRDEQNKSTTNS